MHFCRICPGVIELWTSLSLDYAQLSLALGPSSWGVSILNFETPLWTFVDCSFLPWFAIVQALTRFSLTIVDVGSFLPGFYFFWFSLFGGLGGSEPWGWFFVYIEKH